MLKMMPDPNSPSLETQITSVTVYPQQARITRHGSVQLTGQEEALVIGGLPASLQPESVRATGRGSVAVRLLEVQTVRTYATEPMAERVAQLSREIEQLEVQKRALEDQAQGVQLRQRFATGLLEKSVDRFSRGLAQEQIGLDQTRALMEFVQQQYGDTASQIAQIQQQQHVLEKTLAAAQQTLRQLQTPHSQESFSVTVGILPSGAGDFELEIVYTVNQATWTPLYDLRLNGSADQLQLTYLAEVQQNTGEDWTDVELTLSTAKPALGSLPPKLDPWYVDIYQPPSPAPMMMASAAASVTLKRQRSIERAESAAEFAEDYTAFQAETVVASLSQEGNVVTFKLEQPCRIQSDQAPHKVTIFSADYPCQPKYIAIPKQVSFAYLQAKASNPTTGATLLPGRANIFRDNTFVGTTPLENIAPGQDFSLNLGIDEGLRIQRDLAERLVDKKLIGGQRRITYAYRIEITNLRDQPAELVLTEQLPVSRHEQIKVRLLRADPAIQPSKLGILEWSLSLAGKAKQVVYYQFTVESPADLRVTGLDYS